MTAVTTLVRVTLTLSTPWAVGATPDGSTDVDLPLLIDPRYLTRRPHLPSTSLAGALREHLGADATDWLGPPPPVDDEQPRTPSILCSLGVVLTGAHQLTTYGTTAIDHRRGAARAGSLRLEERAEPAVVSASDKASGSQRAQLTWCLTADEPLPDQLLERLAAWAPYIGRSRSTGMGSTSPLCVEALQLDLDQPEHLTWWLTHRRQWLTTGTGHPRGTTPARFAKGVHRHRLPFGFEVVDPIALGTGAHDTHRASPSERQAAPREIRRSHDRPIVPGSSWKGVFRHRVSFILTALNAEETLITEVVLLLFGAGPKDPGGAHRGLLRFRRLDVDGARPKGSSHQGSIPCRHRPDLGGRRRWQAVPRSRSGTGRSAGSDHRDRPEAA